MNDADCSALGSDPGAACVGVISGSGETCDADTDGCVEKHCKAEWFVSCKESEAGGAFCVDRRFKDKGAGACYVATVDFESCAPVDPADPNIIKFVCE